MGVLPFPRRFTLRDVAEIVGHPMAPAGQHGFPPPEPAEPAPDFRVEHGAVVWGLNGLRLVHAEQFAVLADIFAKNGWTRNANALLDAELAASAPGPEAA